MTVSVQIRHRSERVWNRAQRSRVSRHWAESLVSCAAAREPWPRDVGSRAAARAEDYGAVCSIGIWLHEVSCRCQQTTIVDIAPWSWKPLPNVRFSLAISAFSSPGSTFYGELCYVYPSSPGMSFSSPWSLSTSALVAIELSTWYGGLKMERLISSNRRWVGERNDGNAGCAGSAPISFPRSNPPTL